MSERYRDRVRVTFGVLGPVLAWDDAGEPIALKGPRHRAVLARLIAARGRVVPVGDLVGDLWVAPAEGAVGSVRTFVAALRRALEPQRPARAKAGLLVTEGNGYALRTPAETVDAWRFENLMRLSPGENELQEALGWWRGPAYAEFADEPWTGAERARLAELRLRAVERLAGARIANGHAAAAVPDLDAHVTEHPWREDGWRLLALALYRTGRQADALAVLRRARDLLTDRLGLDPGRALEQLEADILRRRPTESDVWSSLTADYDRIVTTRARLTQSAALLRTLAVSGGLAEARTHRAAAIAAAEELNDPGLTARVIGAYDVPAVWLRSDDPRQAAAIVAAAGRHLAVATTPATRSRLLATMAVDTRGGADRSGEAREAERIARELNDPGLLAFALNGRFIQSAHHIGRSGERDAIGAELVGLSARHGLATSEVLGHLIRMQARSARADWVTADEHATAADRLAREHALPLVAVFTSWYRALRLSWHDPAAAEPVYRRAAGLLDGAGMPGLEGGLLPLALLTVRIRQGLPLPEEGDFGPYGPWVRPLLDPAASLRDLPGPPPDLMAEAMWALVAHAAIRRNDQDSLARARAALAPARGELAGAGSGLVTLGRVGDLLAGGAPG